MRNSLQTHIIFLENTVRNVRVRLARPGLTIEEIEDIELQLSTSESALDHYRQAYALEAKVSGPEPPNQPAGSDPGGEDKSPENSPSRKKKEGLAKVAESSKGQLSRHCRDLSARSGVQLRFGRIPLNALEEYSHLPSRGIWRRRS
jgi:hypothetical protein